jgi:hypothetical protein
MEDEDHEHTVDCFMCDSDHYPVWREDHYEWIPRYRGV